MYHLIKDVDKEFVVVRDTDYKSSGWSHTVPIWREVTNSHWSRNESVGLPIQETLHPGHTLIASSASPDFSATHPELYI